MVDQGREQHRRTEEVVQLRIESSSSSNKYRSLSPESKTQAIARGERELMEMVNNMSHSTYELTLKDLVEPTSNIRVVDNVEEKNKEKKNFHLSNKNIAPKRDGRNNKRSGNNIDSTGGFYLKMVFPICLMKKNTKKNMSLENNNNNSSKVSDKEWWKKKSLSESASMKSSGSSSTGHSSCRRSINIRHEMSASSCWPFIPRFHSLSQK